jgi:hypothetical protein
MCGVLSFMGLLFLLVVLVLVVDQNSKTTGHGQLKWNMQYTRAVSRPINNQPQHEHAGILKLKLKLELHIGLVSREVSWASAADPGLPLTIVQHDLDGRVACVVRVVWVWVCDVYAQCAL